MTAILIVVMALLLIIGLILLYAAFLKRHVTVLASAKQAALDPLIRKLEANEVISNDELVELCEEPSLRPAIFYMLKFHNRENLFPSHYLTFEMGAASYLVSWLEFPTELGEKPNDIEFLEKVILMELEVIDYYVFKFMAPPSPKLPREWMIGACGPYGANSAPYDIPSRVYSRYKVLGTITPESEAQWIHANINVGHND